MGEAAAREPSMEDILSSIRKIIAEEGDDAGARERRSEQQPEGQYYSETESVQPVIEDELVATPAPQSEVAPSLQAEVPIDPGQPQAPVFDTGSGQMGMNDGAAAEPTAATVNVELDEETVQMPGTHETAEPTVTEEATPQMTSRSLADIAASAKAMDHVPSPSPAMVEPSAAPVVAEEPMPASAQQADVHVSEPSVSEKPADVEMAQAIPAPVSATEVPGGSETAQEGAFKGALMSPRVDGAVSDSFDRLKRSMMDDLEAKTESILRPMLREWLDENLPNLVERLVREEIERVARGN